MATGLEIVFRPDPAVGDGAMSNNAWLQEMPKPQNKMTWDNAVWVSPKSAEHYGVATGDVIEIQRRRAEKCKVRCGCCRATPTNR